MRRFSEFFRHVKARSLLCRTGRGCAGARTTTTEMTNSNDILKLNSGRENQDRQKLSVRQKTIEMGMDIGPVSRAETGPCYCQEARRVLGIHSHTSHEQKDDLRYSKVA